MEPVAAAGRVCEPMAYIDATVRGAGAAAQTRESSPRGTSEAGKGRLASVAGSSAEVLASQRAGPRRRRSAEQRQQRGGGQPAAAGPAAPTITTRAG